MSSSGLASSTTKSALLPASTVPAVGDVQQFCRVARRRDDDLVGRHACRPPYLPSRQRAPGCVTVRAHRDPHARCIQPRQVACLDGERFLRDGLVGGGGLQLLQLRGRIVSLSQPRSVATPRSARFGTTMTFGRSLKSAMISSSTSLSRTVVRERVDARAQEPLPIFEGEDVGGHAEPVLVSFVDELAR